MTAKKPLLEKMICKNHTGKMSGMLSLSTSCTDNKLCIARAKNPNTICSHCYAFTMAKQYSNLEKKNIRNGEFLKNNYLSDSDIPFLNCAFFRFEAFGDIETIKQVINYFLICHKNPHVHFSLYTKNPCIIDLAMASTDCPSKPKNLIIVYSSPFVNKQASEYTLTRYPFIDKVFTVYDKAYAKENDIKINCGAKHCLTCQRCYKRNTSKYINELLK